MRKRKTETSSFQYARVVSPFHGSRIARISCVAGVQRGGRGEVECERS